MYHEEDAAAPCSARYQGRRGRGRGDLGEVHTTRVSVAADVHSLAHTIQAGHVDEAPLRGVRVIVGLPGAKTPLRTKIQRESAGDARPHLGDDEL